VKWQPAEGSPEYFSLTRYPLPFARQLKVKLVTEDAKLRTAVPSWTLSLADALI
jgi:hypothetical protein